jgi:hypothetical protein
MRRPIVADQRINSPVVVRFGAVGGRTRRVVGVGAEDDRPVPVPDPTDAVAARDPGGAPGDVEPAGGCPSRASSRWTSAWSSCTRSTLWPEATRRLVAGCRSERSADIVRALTLPTTATEGHPAGFGQDAATLRSLSNTSLGRLPATAGAWSRWPGHRRRVVRGSGVGVGSRKTIDSIRATPGVAAYARPCRPRPGALVVGNEGQRCGARLGGARLLAYSTVAK